MVTKRLTVMLLLAAAACDGAPDRVVGPAEPSQPTTSTSSSCDPPTTVSPTGYTLVSGSGTRLIWNKDPVCAWVHRVEVHNSGGTLVWYDDQPQQWTFEVGGTYEYRHPQLSNLTPGRYYSWRVRSYYLTYAGTVGPISPWSTPAHFGVRLATPVVSGSVDNGNASLTWSAVNGATAYQVHRYWSVQPWAGWEDLGTVAGTSFTDVDFSVSAYTGQSAPSQNAFLTYYVVAVGEAGIRSQNSAWHYFALPFPPGEMEEPY